VRRLITYVSTGAAPLALHCRRGESYPPFLGAAPVVIEAQ